MTTTQQARAWDRRSIMIAAAQRTNDATHDEMTEALIATIGNALDLCAHVTEITFEPSDQGEFMILDEVTCSRHTNDECPAQVPHALEDYAAHLYTEHLIWAQDHLGMIPDPCVDHWSIPTSALRTLINA